ARRLLRDLVRLAQGFTEPFGARREDELRAEGLEKLSALDGKRIGHDQDAAIAFRRRDERQADAGVAAGRLDDDALARLDLAALLRVFDHRQRDAVFDR